MDNQLFTIEEMAAALKVPRSWLYGKTRLKGPDTIPCLRVGKHIRFNPLEVRAWLRNRQREGD